MMLESMQQYMRTCSSADRGYILKVLAELTDRTDFDSALQTINQALRYQVTDPDSLKNLYSQLYSDVPEMLPLPQQSGIPDVAQMPTDLSAYDRKFSTFRIQSIILWSSNPLFRYGFLHKWFMSSILFIFFDKH